MVLFINKFRLLGLGQDRGARPEMAHEAGRRLHRGTLKSSLLPGSWRIAEGNVVFLLRWFAGGEIQHAEMPIFVHPGLLDDKP